MILLYFGLLLTARAESHGTSKSGPEIVASAGPVVIRADEFARRLNEIRGRAETAPEARSFLEDLIGLKLGAAEANKLGLDSDPAMKDAIEQVMYDAWLERSLGPSIAAIRVDESEMREFYRRNPVLHLAYILIDVKSGASAEAREAARKRAGEITHEIRGSARLFADFVKMYSDDATTLSTAGDLGEQSRISLRPEIYSALKDANTGAIVGPVNSRDGYHIYKIVERRPYDLADRRIVRAAVFDNKRAKLFADSIAKLKKKVRVSVDKAALTRAAR